MIWLALLTGVVTALVIRWTTKRERLRAAIKRIHADLLEFRLYFDEPALIWRAQKNLVRDNLRLLAQFVPAILILGLAMAWLIPRIEASQADRPLRAGEEAVFTVQLNRPIAAADRFELHPAPGIRVETPPIRLPHSNEVSWRIRSANGGRASLNVSVNGRENEVVRMDVNYPRSEPAVPWWLSFLLISSASALVVMAV